MNSRSEQKCHDRLVRARDGVAYSIRLLDFHHGALYPSCVAIQHDVNALVGALAACWGFVDTLHRLREIVCDIPRLKAATPEIQSFLTTSADVKNFRNYIQHLRTELQRPPGTPVWGTLAWADETEPLRCHAVMVGECLPGMRYVAGVFDTVEKRWASRVSLSLGASSFHFDLQHAEVRALERFLSCWFPEHGVNAEPPAPRPFSVALISAPNP